MVANSNNFIHYQIHFDVYNYNWFSLFGISYPTTYGDNRGGWAISVSVFQSHDIRNSNALLLSKVSYFECFVYDIYRFIKSLVFIVWNNKFWLMTYGIKRTESTAAATFVSFRLLLRLFCCTLHITWMRKKTPNMRQSQISAIYDMESANKFFPKVEIDF